MDAMILLAHGARNDAWARPFQAIRDLLVAGREGLVVSLAFLELMEPDFATAFDRLAEAGATRIVVCPLFLGAGGHVAKDVPLLLETARRRWPTVAVECTPTLGEDPAVLRAIAGMCARHAQGGRAESFFEP